jgi:hypothetical protein
MTMRNHCLERVLFIVGSRHSGKSTQLRSLFRDVRLGTGGTIPRQRKLDDFHRLSNEQFLYLRLTSPHELKESLGAGKRGVADFLRKTEDKVKRALPKFGTRWNFASALQPDASNNMPNVVETCKTFVRYFEPERTRIVFLNPAGASWRRRISIACPDASGESLPSKSAGSMRGTAKGMDCCWRISCFPSVLRVSYSNLLTQLPRTLPQHPDVVATAVI